MIQETALDKILYRVKKLIPKSVFNFFQPVYHAILANAGALIYRYPSKSMKVIGVTGTKGKSTTVFLLSKILENSGHKVAACGSLGFKIGEKEWPNNLKMTMPGRFKIHKFMAEARKAGCEFLVLEVTSEGVKQKRHLGIRFDCAVFTNLHKEHIEAHGSFENYAKAKQELFRATKNIHVLNADDPNIKLFGDFFAKRKIFYGIEKGDIHAEKTEIGAESSVFDIYGTQFKINIGGRFNVSNCLAALAVSAMYGIDLPSARPVLESIKSIPGRMEFIQSKPFAVVVDYAHTPESLKEVYKALQGQIANGSNLIGVLGSAGGGRDKWKRAEFGKIASEYCNEIILTNEDPYEENPLSILKQIESGFSKIQNPNIKFQIILDRKEAIRTAIKDAREGDVVVITGKGSENSMAVAGGKKIPWSDRQIVSELLAAN